MMTDANTNFIQPGAAAVSVVAGAGVTVQLGQVIDLMGSGVGTAPPNIIGNTTLWGHDPGIGRVKPEIEINIGTAFTTSNSATATFALQYAADAGTPTYQPSTWYTSSETQAHAVSVMTANQVIRMDVTPSPPEVTNPRFVRLIVYPPASTNMSAGTVTFAGLTMARDDQVNKNIPNNYTVA